MSDSEQWKGQKHVHGSKMQEPFGLFSITFHDLGLIPWLSGLENLNSNFHDFPVSVCTLMPCTVHHRFGGLYKLTYLLNPLQCIGNCSNSVLYQGPITSRLGPALHNVWCVSISARYKTDVSKKLAEDDDSRREVVLKLCLQHSSKLVSRNDLLQSRCII